MAGGTLECAVFALVALAIDLVRVVAAVILVVALPTGRDTFAVGAMELGFRAFPVFAFTDSFQLIAAITAIISKIAHPLSANNRQKKAIELRFTPHLPYGSCMLDENLLGNATIVTTFKIGLQIAGRTILNLFIAVVSAVVFAIAEQPFRNAAVIRLAGTTLPTLGAVALTAHVGRLIGVISAVIVEVTHP